MIQELIIIPVVIFYLMAFQIVKNVPIKILVLNAKLPID